MEGLIKLAILALVIVTLQPIRLSVSADLTATESH